MKTSVEKEFAYDASIMVASQEITGECEEGLTVVSSIRTLRRWWKISKNNTAKIKSSNSNTSEEEVVKASSENNSIKSSNSRTSWSLQPAEHPRVHQMSCNLLRVSGIRSMRRKQVNHQSFLLLKLLLYLIVMTIHQFIYYSMRIKVL